MESSPCLCPGSHQVQMNLMPLSPTTLGLLVTRNTQELPPKERREGMI